MILSSTWWLLFVVTVSLLSVTRVSSSSSSSGTRSVYITRSGDGIGDIPQSDRTRFNFLLINGGSSFFDPVQVGWDNACRDSNMNCQYYRHDEIGGEDCFAKQNETLYQIIHEYQLVHGGGSSGGGDVGDVIVDDGSTNVVPEATSRQGDGLDVVVDGNATEAPTMPQIKRYFFGDTLDGIALGPCNAELITPAINDVVDKTGIPIVVFDTDVTDSKRAAYIATDNVFMGVTMAKVLKQLRPEGGTFAVITPPNGTKPNIDQRYSGFKQEIMKDNDKDDNDENMNINKSL